MEGRIPAALKEMFGDEVLDHTLVLLTCADYLMRMSVQVFEFAHCAVTLPTCPPYGSCWSDRCEESI